LDAGADGDGAHLQLRKLYFVWRVNKDWALIGVGVCKYA
jgi:hypothetical protein